MFLVSSWSCLCPVHWSQVLSREWSCSWNSADKYIRIINDFIDATYIRVLTVSNSDKSILKESTRTNERTGARFNIKMLSYQYRKSHCGDKTVVRSSYLHNGISYTGKMSSLYWIGAQIGMPCSIHSGGIKIKVMISFDMPLTHKDINAKNRNIYSLYISYVIMFNPLKLLCTQSSIYASHLSPTSVHILCNIIHKNAILWDSGDCASTIKGAAVLR